MGHGRIVHVRGDRVRTPRAHDRVRREGARPRQKLEHPLRAAHRDLAVALRAAAVVARRRLVVHRLHVAVGAGPVGQHRVSVVLVLDNIVCTTGQLKL
eukprot:7019240-Prymnesium_polylepis.2